MKMNKLTKLITVLLSVALLIGSALCIGASATDAEPSVEITAKNLSYGGKISIAFAVKTANTDNAPELLVYKSEPASTDTAADYTVTEYTEKTVKGESALVFLTPGIAPSNMNTAIYARARVATDVGYAYSELVRYSITEYAYEVQYNADVDEAFSDFGATLITYGTQLAGLLGEADTPAAKKYVAIADGYEGTVDGKYSSGIFASGETVNLVFNGTVPEGMENTGMWKNELDSSVVSGENLSATSHGVYSPVFAPKYVAGEYFNGTQEGTREDFADANLNLPITGGTVSDGSLVFSGNGGHAIGNNAEDVYEVGTTYVFESDFTYNGGAPVSASDLNAAFVGLLATSTSHNNSMISYGYINFVDSEGSAITMFDHRFEKNVKYNIRLEYTVGGETLGTDTDAADYYSSRSDYVRAHLKFYVNGVEKALSTNNNVMMGKNVSTDTEYYGFGVYTRNSDKTSSLDITFDNVYMAPKSDNVLDSFYETATSGNKYGFDTDVAETNILGSGKSGLIINGVNYDTYSDSATGKYSIADGKLNVSNVNWFALQFAFDGANTGYASGDKYVFEADITYNGGTGLGDMGAAFAGFYKQTTGSEPLKNGSMHDPEYFKYSSDSSTINLYGATIQKGATVKVTVILDLASNTVTTYANGAIVSDAAISVTAADGMYGFGFYFRGTSYTSNLSLTFDNVYVGVIEAE